LIGNREGCHTSRCVTINVSATALGAANECS
jgi:hypothetical protein